MDHVVLDDYDLSLWKIPAHKDIDPGGILYVVSLNSEQHDPGDEKEQRTKFPGTSARHLPYTTVVRVLRDWVKHYGKIAVGSLTVKKLSAYRVFLQNKMPECTFTDMVSGEPDYGFFIGESI